MIIPFIIKATAKAASFDEIWGIMISPRLKFEFSCFDELVERTPSAGQEMSMTTKTASRENNDSCSSKAGWRRRPATEQGHADETGADSVVVGRDYNACCKRARSTTLRVLQSIAIGPGERHLGSM
jgi:hypothetical protein